MGSLPVPGRPGKVLQPRLNPYAAGDPLALGTMPIAARIVGTFHIPARIANIYMVTKFTGTAMLDIEHHRMLLG
jgi:hypothetical protein